MRARLQKRHLARISSSPKEDSLLLQKTYPRPASEYYAKDGLDGASFLATSERRLLISPVELRRLAPLHYIEGLVLQGLRKR